MNNTINIISFTLFKENDDRPRAKIEPVLPAQKPKTSRLRADLRKTFNGIQYVLKAGSKSTVHRLHLELCGSGAYQKINQLLISEGYLLRKIDLSGCNMKHETETRPLVLKNSFVLVPTIPFRSAGEHRYTGNPLRAFSCGHLARSSPESTTWVAQYILRIR